MCIRDRLILRPTSGVYWALGVIFLFKMTVKKKRFLKFYSIHYKRLEGGEPMAPNVIAFFEAESIVINSMKHKTSIFIVLLNSALPRFA